MELENNWKYKTLESLGKEEWDNALAECSIEDVIQLGKKQLINISVGELKLLIWQNVCLKYTIPLAMRYLNKNPLITGDLTIDSLLEEVLLSDIKYWKSSKTLWKEVLDLVDSNYESIMKQAPKKIFRMEMENAIDNFREINKSN